MTLIAKDRVGTREAEEPSAIDGAMGSYALGADGEFAKIFGALAPRLRAFLVRLGAKGRADDLVQETFLRIHRARGSFTPGARAVPWAYSIARNVFWDELRRGRGASLVSIEGRDDDGPTANVPTGEEDAIARESANAVARALERMPSAQREAFVMLRFEGLSVEDAARVAGVTEAALKVRAFRAYEILRAALNHPSRTSARKETPR